MSHSRAESDRTKYGYKDVRYRSPASDNNLYIVSFPAISILGENHILTSMSSVSGRKYSINNVQMRAASFKNTTDQGYGLVCKNEGIIYNIYTNNLNLILSEIKDGELCDYSGSGNELRPSDDPVTITRYHGKLNYLDNADNNRVGGLVGYNTGLIGTNDSNVSIDQNVVSMNNSLVLAGKYWNLYDYNTGGVIGQNDGTNVNSENVSTFGVIEVRGGFAIASGGTGHVGGIIGYNDSDVGARLVVNGDPINDSSFSSEFTLPEETHFGRELSCVISGAGNVGGAIGYSYDCGFIAPVTKTLKTDSIDSDPVTGELSLPKLDDSDYQIDVILPSDSMVLMIGGDSYSVGGAVGRLYSGTGDYASIKVFNNGHIVTSDKAEQNKSVSCGGAIGEDSDNSITTMYINITNGLASKLGPYNDDTGPIRTGGAVGHIGSDGAGSSRTMVISAVNDGSITARGAGNGQGAGGAIGGITDPNPIVFYINAVNNVNSTINGNGENYSKGNGTGGAIGGMVNADYDLSLPVDSIIYAKNYGLIEGVSHVGGTIGNVPLTRGKIYAENHGTITGNNYVGGAVGKHIYNHYGTIQSILYGNCEISGANFVGGAAGRISNFIDNAVLRTIVRGDTSVDGTGSIVGGICGDLRIAGNGNGGKIELVGDSSDPLLTVSGADGVGGAIGLMRSELVNKAKVETPGQTSTNKLAIHVSGRNHIGGVVGCIRATDIGANETNISNLFNNSAIIQDILVTISAKFSSRSYIIGSGENVGGAVGYITGKFDNGSYSTFGGIIYLTTASGSTTGTAYISGKRFVGGAVGHFDSVVPMITDIANAHITVDLSSALWDIETTVSAGNEADVGGAVGYFQGKTDKKYGTNDNDYPISVNLGPTRITSSGYNVGGVIGRNSVRNGNISATNISGTISGQYNIGGAIGFNEYRFTEANATVLASGVIKALGSNPNNVINNMADGAKGNGSNVGGVVGLYCFTSNSLATITSEINAEISGKIIGPGNNVGGAVGFCSSNKNVHLIQNVIATLQGAAVVQGADNVGGGIGFSQSNISAVQVTISGSSNVIGEIHVGGAIGWTYATDDKGGDDVFYAKAADISQYSISKLETELENTKSPLYKASGRIGSITVTISSDYALQGRTYIGGAVGQSGFKTLKNGNHWVSPALISVNAIINTGYLFDPFDTGNPGGNASVGGVIGLVIDGRIEAVSLTGSGGVVNTDSNYPCPKISETGAVLIAASGKSVGGVIGQIGLESTTEMTLTAGNAQKVTVSNISADDRLHLCVVSMDNSDRIGGWIGSAFGKFGGLGNRSSGDFGNASKKAKYNVNNVKYVFSRGDFVGGFCGYSRGYGARETYFEVDVKLSNATVTGRNGVGGAFGIIYSVNLKSGFIKVSLSNHSVIGDNNGSSLCQEAGGAVGNLYQEKDGDTKPVLSIPISVTIDKTSCIWSEGGNAEATDTPEYGVGGVLGKAYGEFAKTGVLSVNADVPTSVSVYSRYSNVGGVIGVIDNAQMNAYADKNRSYAVNVSVRSDGDYACAGGFVGRISSMASDMYYCYCYGDVLVKSNGTKSCAGGFVGYASWAGTDDRQIKNSYTTASVSSSGEYTGGFVGRLLHGTISSCYVGGHTYQGSYAAGEGNVTGKGNVGGFAGATTGTSNVKFDNCYSTASVLGTTDNIGGFIGNATTKTVVTNCYCTGKITCPNTLTSGAFAGYIGSADAGNYTGNKAMRFVNAGSFPLYGESCSSAIQSVNIDYADDVSIKGSRKDNGHSFDETLPKTFGLRAVIGTDHYGDWPRPSNGTTIDDAVVQIFVETGEDEQGISTYDWQNFENNTYEDEFNGTAVTIDGNKLRLLVQGAEVPKENYTIYYRDNNKVGTATITFAAKSGSTYSGAVSRTFKITEANIEGATASIETPIRAYTGADIDLDETVTYKGVTLVRETDYTLAYDKDGNIEDGFDNDHVSIGVTHVYVIGKGNYTGTKMIGTLEITAINVSELDDIVLIGADNLVYDEDEQGNPVEHKPSVVVRYNNQTLKGVMKDPEKEYSEYAENCDYVFSYEDNTNAGTAYLVITGTADPSIGTGSIYTGVKREPFTISPAKNSWVEGQEPAIVGWTYGDDPNEPTGTLKYGNIDYAFYSDVSCSEASKIADITTVGAGNYYVKVFAEASDNYTGPEAAILIFTITPKSINGISSVSISPDEYLYTGDPIEIRKEDITVTIGEGDSAYTLGQDDFTIESYDPADHKGPGEVTLTIAGTGNYTGTNTVRFTIYCNYLVHFMSDGQEYTSLPVREGKSVNDTVDEFVIPVNEGYRLDGWYKEQDYSTEFSFDDAITGEITVYAKWVKYWEITFVTGDPDVVIADNPQHVDQGKYVIRPADPERTGYHFDGWYNEFGILYEFDTKVYENITLTARWTPTYNVSFDTGEGGPAVDSQEVVEGKQATEPSDPVWDGHHFSGWYSDATYATEYDFDTPVTEAITIYAKWTYKVNFDTGEDGSDVEPQYVSENGQATEPSDPTREGYHFAGWYSDEECTTEYDFDTSVVADITLYAKWAYKVTFSTGSGSAVAPQLVVKDGKAQEPADPPVWEGHTFKGWYSDEGCTQLYDFATLVKGDITIYAKWE